SLSGRIVGSGDPRHNRFVAADDPRGAAGACRRGQPGCPRARFWRIRRVRRVYWAPVVKNLRRRPPLHVVGVAALTLLAWLTLPARAARAADELLTHVDQPWKGDLDQMIKRRRVRVLVTYSKTFYFLDRGRQRGATYDAMHAFEDELNKRLGNGH